MEILNNGEDIIVGGVTREAKHTREERFSVVEVSGWDPSDNEKLKSIVLLRGAIQPTHSAIETQAVLHPVSSKVSSYFIRILCSGVKEIFCLIDWKVHGGAFVAIVRFDLAIIAVESGEERSIVVEVQLNESSAVLTTHK